MKINKAKMMVSTLAIIAGAATVGSISGTVAWFQYNTRVTAAYVGTTASVSRNLQIRIADEHVTNYEPTNEDNEFKTNLEAFDIKTYLAAKDALKADEGTKAYAKGSGQNVAPVTYGTTAKDAALPSTGNFVNGPKGNPMAGQFAYNKWADASHDNYITIPLQLKLVDGAGANLSGKKIFLTDLTLKAHGTETVDTSTALAVHFACGTKYQLWTKTGTDIATSASLDLDGDGMNDKVRDRYIFSDGSDALDGLEDGVYGDVEGSKITSYNASSATKNTATCPMADDSEADLDSPNADYALGATDSNGLLTVNVTIWFEGWALLNPASGSTDSAVWNSKYAGKSFDVGMSFATPNVG